jgi:hypothetical protein
MNTLHDNLVKEKERRNTYARQQYVELYKQCIDIIRIDSKNNDKCIFVIPKASWNGFVYEYRVAAKYIVHKLKEQGFNVLRNDEAQFLVITW